MGESNDDDSNQLGIFLNVEKAPDGYIETDRKGDRHRYVRVKRRSVLTIETLNTHHSIDLAAGDRVTTIRGRTREKVRAIGATGDYPIFHVELIPGDRPGHATMTEIYTPGGHSLRSRLVIEASPSAMLAISETLMRSRIARVLSAKFEEGTFFGTKPDLHDEVLLLPWLEEQKKVTGTEVSVQYDLTVSDLTISPEHAAGFMTFTGEADKTAQQVHAGISGDVNVHYPDSRHPLQTGIEEGRSELSRLRASIAQLAFVMVAIAILIALYIYHIW